MGVCALEASDLCLFFRAVNDSVGGIVIRVLNLTLTLCSNGRTLCLAVGDRELFVDVFVRKVVSHWV